MLLYHFPAFHDPKGGDFRKIGAWPFKSETLSSSVGSVMNSLTGLGECLSLLWLQFIHL